MTRQSATDKAVILARGLGTRMRRPDENANLNERQRAIAETGVKALIPIALPSARPFLDYVLSALADAGFGRVCLVVAPQHSTIRRYYEEEARPVRLRIEFAVQEEPRGTADAVAAAELFAAGDPFVAINSDNYYPLEALGGLRGSEGCAVALFERESMLAGSNMNADRIRQFAVGRIDRAGHLEGILEKPDEKTLAAMVGPLWVGVNCWRFGPAIFEACRHIGLSPRGELEITDAVQYAVDVLGEPFRVLKIRAPVLDMTSRNDVAGVAEKLADVEVEL